jgi:hypothetical protein
MISAESNYGEMSEWSIVLPWKGSVESNQPGVRISLSPYHVIYVIINYG